MKNLITGLAFALLIIGCKKTEKAPENSAIADSVVNQKSAATEDNHTPPMNYGDAGSVYISEDGKTKFRVLSDGNGSLSFKDESSGKIYQMKRVLSAGGEMYEDLEGNFILFKDEEFLFGDAAKKIASGKLQK